jgi:hypothetical protein
MIHVPPVGSVACLPPSMGDILGLTVGPGLAGRGWLGGDHSLCSLFFSRQGVISTSMSEVTAKLAGEGTWPHKLRPCLGPRQWTAAGALEGEGDRCYLFHIHEIKTAHPNCTPSHPFLSMCPHPALFETGSLTL